MNLIPVTSLDTPDLTIFRDLRGGAVSGNLFIADSPKVVNLLLEDARITALSLLATPEYYSEHVELVTTRGVPACYVAEKRLMESIVGHRLHHNVMLCGEVPQESSLAGLHHGIVMLENITSSENVGAIARSAAGLGVGSLLLPQKGPHPFGRRALRVSMGYVSRLRVHRYDDPVATIRSLQERGYRVAAAEITPDSVPLQAVTVPEKWVLLLGHESEGVSPEVLAACDRVVHIEMAEDVKSLNVAAAAAILMHRFVSGM